MTVIEFFNSNAIENMLSALLCHPEKVIFVGKSVRWMKQHLCAYEEVLRGRCLDVQLQIKGINKHDLQGIVDTLESIVLENTDCVFNLDGGEDLCLVAVGMIAQRYPDRVKLHRFNIRAGTIVDCDADGNDQLSESIAISIEENVRIYGGKVMTGAGETYPWVYSEEFCTDVRNMWRICQIDPRKWNAIINHLNTLRGLSGKNTDGLGVFIPISVQKASSNERNLTQLRQILQLLEGFGVICQYSDDREGIRFRYKNRQILQALSKAGTLLELFITVTARGCFAGDERVYNDVACGVSMDWDGVRQENRADVTNEVDVVLMHGAVPVFISCKNGDVDMEELYKLHTVAQRFGGKYAKKVLVSGCLDSMGTKGQYIRLRAKELQIRVLEDIHELDAPKLEKLIAGLWHN